MHTVNQRPLSHQLQQYIAEYVIISKKKTGPYITMSTTTKTKLTTTTTRIRGFTRMRYTNLLTYLHHKSSYNPQESEQILILITAYH